MTDQLCGGRGLPDSPSRVVWWFDDDMFIGTFKDGVFEYDYDIFSCTARTVDGWAYLSEVRAVPKMIAALEDVSDLALRASRVWSASETAFATIQSKADQALAAAKGEA